MNRSKISQIGLAGAGMVGAILYLRNHNSATPRRESIKVKSTVKSNSAVTNAVKGIETAAINCDRKKTAELELERSFVEIVNGARSEDLIEESNLTQGSMSRKKILPGCGAARDNFTPLSTSADGTIHGFSTHLMESELLAALKCADVNAPLNTIRIKTLKSGDPINRNYRTAKVFPKLLEELDDGVEASTEEESS